MVYLVYYTVWTLDKEETINELIGEEKGEKLSPGHVVKAMILNGLGFVSRPLYMFPQFERNHHNLSSN